MYIYARSRLRLPEQGLDHVPRRLHRLLRHHPPRRHPSLPQCAPPPPPPRRPPIRVNPSQSESIRVVQRRAPPAETSGATDAAAASRPSPARPRSPPSRSASIRVHPAAAEPPSSSLAQRTAHPRHSGPYLRVARPTRRRRAPAPAPPARFEFPRRPPRPRWAGRVGRARPPCPGAECRGRPSHASRPLPSRVIRVVAPAEPSESVRPRVQDLHSGAGRPPPHCGTVIRVIRVIQGRTHPSHAAPNRRRPRRPHVRVEGCVCACVLRRQWGCEARAPCPCKGHGPGLCVREREIV